MVRKPTPEVATGLELPGLENHEPQNPFVFINGFTCGVPPSSMESLCQTAARWQQRGVCAAAPEVSESQGRFPKPGKPQEPPPPRQAQLTLPGGAQTSSSPWTLPIPKGKGQNPEPLLSVLIALPANGGRRVYQMTWLLTFARATFFPCSFYFLRPSHSTVQAGLKVSPCSPAWPRTRNSPFASSSLVPGL